MEMHPIRLGGAAGTLCRSRLRQHTPEGVSAACHAWYGSAAAMMVPGLHERIVAKPF